MSIPVSIPKFVGADVEIVISAAASGAVALVNVDTISIKARTRKVDHNPAEQARDGFLLVDNGYEGTANGLQGGRSHAGTLPKKGDYIRTFAWQTVVSGDDLVPDDVLDNATHGWCVVTEVSFDRKRDESTWSFSFETGCNTPPANSTATALIN